MNPEGEDESKEEEVKNTKRSKNNPKEEPAKNSKNQKQSMETLPEIEEVIDYENKVKEAANARLKHIVELLQ